ncbi:MAG: transcription termination/antitermination NusG family protein [Planctomycetota bacterium]
MLKLQDNPPMRLDPSGSVREYSGSWWVAHTKSRHEKALAWDLHHSGIGYYLPMLLRETMSGGRKRRQLQPLFTSYVFFCGEQAERYQAMTTNRVANILPVTERDRFVAEISAIECAIDSGQVLRLYQSFEQGERCRVTRGPMAGQEGRVVRVDGVERVVLFISILGRGAELEIHGDHLERIDEGAG